MIKKLFNEWKSLNKAKSKSSEAAIKSRENFKTKLSETLDITHHKAVEEIMKDRLRDDSQKEEDIQFLNIVKQKRKASLGKEDKKYTEGVQAKLKRDKLESEKLKKI